MVLYTVEKAIEAGISPHTAIQVIACESSWNEKAVGDGGTSFGLVQIHLPAHPEVSQRKAEDPEFAINFLVNALKNGDGWMWTCYRNLK